MHNLGKFNLFSKCTKKKKKKGNQKRDNHNSINGEEESRQSHVRSKDVDV